VAGDKLDDEPDARAIAFAAFFPDARDRIQAALTARWGPQVAQEATADALAWAWEHWERVESMENAVGYLYRVGSTKAKRMRARTELPTPSAPVPTEFEPELVPALNRLSQRQREVVILVVGYGWSQQEVANLLGLSHSSVRSHLERGMTSLRRSIGVR
jgi:RNA polymerase sigma factor (sigma-70 family)